MRGSIPLLTGAAENLCTADAGCSDLLFGRGCRGVGLPTLLGPLSKVIPSGALVSILDVGHLPERLIIFLSNYSHAYLPEPDAFDVCSSPGLLLSPLVIVTIVIPGIFLTHHTLCHRTESRTLPASGHRQWDR